MLKSLASYAGDILRRRGVHDRVVDGRLYVYASFAHPGLRRRAQQRRTVLRAVLGPAPCIFDIGAHNGATTALYRWIDARVVCVEPDSASLHLDALIEQWGRPDYIKVDVEGAELSVLQGLQPPVRFLSFEALLPPGPWFDYQEIRQRVGVTWT